MRRLSLANAVRQWARGNTRLYYRLPDGPVTGWLHIEPYKKSGGWFFSRHHEYALAERGEE